MSLHDIVPYLWNILGLLLISVLVVLTVMLLTRGKRSTGRDTATEGKAAAADRKNEYPGIDPADYADVAEQQAVLDRLSELPQFRRMMDGTLVEWGTGAHIAPCDCRRPPVPHLMICWGTDWAQGVVTRNGLAHYLAYHERVAAVLLSRRQAPDAGGDTKGQH